MDRTIESYFSPKAVDDKLQDMDSSAEIRSNLALTDRIINDSATIYYARQDNPEVAIQAIKRLANELHEYFPDKDTSVLLQGALDIVREREPAVLEQMDEEGIPVRRINYDTQEIEIISAQKLAQEDKIELPQSKPTNVIQAAIPSPETSHYITVEIPNTEVSARLIGAITVGAVFSDTRQVA